MASWGQLLLSAVMDDRWWLIDGRQSYNIKKDIGQIYNVAAEHPTVERRLRESYNRWRTSLAKENINQKYAYIKAGTRHENPVRMSSHDMQIYPNTYAWHQYGSLMGAQGTGILKLEIVRSGSHRIDLRRYSPKSGLAFNQQVSAAKETIEISSPHAGVRAAQFKQSYCYLSRYRANKTHSGGYRKGEF